MPDYEHASLTFNEKKQRWERKWHEHVDGARKRRTTPNAKWLWEKHNGPIPDGFVIHHRDFDGTNDTLENLVCLSDEEHRRLHWEANNGYRVIEGVDHKICTECGELLPFLAFSMERHNKKGTIKEYPRAKCKSCSSRIAIRNKKKRDESNNLS